MYIDESIKLLDKVIFSYSYDEMSERNIFLVDKRGEIVARNPSVLKNLLLTDGIIHTQDQALSLLYFSEDKKLCVYILGKPSYFFIQDVSQTSQLEMTIEDDADMEKGILDFLTLLDIYYKRLDICLNDSIKVELLK